MESLAAKIVSTGLDEQSVAESTRIGSGGLSSLGRQPSQRKEILDKNTPGGKVKTQWLEFTFLNNEIIFVQHIQF